MNICLLVMALLLSFIVLPGTVQLLFLSLSAWLPKRKNPVHTNSAYKNSVHNNPMTINLAIVIPAHNEEVGIGQTLKSLQACDNPLDNNNIFVVADNCTDQTIKVANQHGVSVIERDNMDKRGKGYALCYAFNILCGGSFVEYTAERSTGEKDIKGKDAEKKATEPKKGEGKNNKKFDGFIIVDADTLVEKNFIDVFRHLFAKGESTGQARYRVKNINAGIRPRLMNIAFLAFNLLRPLARDNVRLSAGILGNGFGLSTKTLKKVPYDSFSIVEDLEYHLRLVQSGIKVRFLDSTTVWSDMPVTGADAQSQRERWEGGRFRLMKEQVPVLISQVAKGQFRLIEPLFDLLLLPLTFHVALLLCLLLIGSYPFKLFALLALTIVLFHVVTAMFMGRATWQDWKALLSAPFYIIWKLTKLGGILKTAKKGSVWKRTHR